MAVIYTHYFIQVGNAVPPPMSRAIGLEINKCLQWKAEQEPTSIKEIKEDAEMEEDEKPKQEMTSELKKEEVTSPCKAGSSMN